VEAIGPAGQFFFDELVHTSIVLLAAGSGITPMISILRFLDDRCLDTEATLFYTVRMQRDILFEAELRRLTKSLPHFTSLIALTRPEPGWEGLSGHVTGDVLPDIVKRQRQAVFFICGPESFMSDATEALTELGIPSSHIKREAFGSRTAIQSSVNDRPRIGVAEFARSAVKCDIPPELTLLEVAERNGITIPYSCRQGQCGTCATRLLEGSVRMDSEVGLSDEVRAQGCILPCVSRAQKDVKLDA
jgi:ferredoxin-NADP reductase